MPAWALVTKLSILLMEEEVGIIEKSGHRNLAWHSSATASAG